MVQRGGRQDSLWPGPLISCHTQRNQRPAEEAVPLVTQPPAPVSRPGSPLSASQAPEAQQGGDLHEVKLQLEGPGCARNLSCPLNILGFPANTPEGGSVQLSLPEDRLYPGAHSAQDISCSLLNPRPLEPPPVSKSTALGWPQRAFPSGPPAPTLWGNRGWGAMLCWSPTPSQEAWWKALVARPCKDGIGCRWAPR